MRENAVYVVAASSSSSCEAAAAAAAAAAAGGGSTAAGSVADAVDAEPILLKLEPVRRPDCDVHARFAVLPRRRLHAAEKVPAQEEVLLQEVQAEEEEKEEEGEEEEGLGH